MKTLTKEAYEQVRTWVHRNARELELAQWNYFFEGGAREAVVTALARYQNADGGFGNAVEPDNWTQVSMPYSTSYAIKLLTEAGCTDQNHPVWRGIWRYLASGASTQAYGWMFAVPETGDAPHAPWWEYNEAQDAAESVGLTAELCACVLRYGEVGSPLYAKALQWSRELLQKMMQADSNGEMGVGGYIILLQTIREKQVPGFDVDALQTRLSELVEKGIEHDEKKWSTYCPRPTNYVRDPQSVYYAQNQAVTDAGLDYLIDTRHEHGVWDITWLWYGNMDKYGAQFAVSENWWKGIWAIEHMRVLRNFGRVEK
ncbi:MAG: hypothetical protein PHD32_07140 [Eubacteriales bacterium]|nr:hypothetical protein [Eubacteriales bacterium]